MIKYGELFKKFINKKIAEWNIDSQPMWRKGIPQKELTKIISKK